MPVGESDCAIWSRRARIGANFARQADRPLSAASEGKQSCRRLPADALIGHRPTATPSPAGPARFVDSVGSASMTSHRGVAFAVLDHSEMLGCDPATLPVGAFSWPLVSWCGACGA